MTGSVKQSIGQQAKKAGLLRFARNDEQDRIRAGSLKIESENQSTSSRASEARPGTHMWTAPVPQEFFEV
jgi:hypothetical protein